MKHSSAYSPLARAVGLGLCLVLTACQAPTEPGARGTLEYKRIELRADSAETLLELQVQEGDLVSTGDLIAQLDDRRARAALAAADLYVCDRVSQCAVSGELEAARAAGLMQATPPELGGIVSSTVFILVNKRKESVL